MSSFTGSNSQYDYMIEMWKVAHRNNQKPKKVTVRKSKPGAHHPVYWG